MIDRLGPISAEGTVEGDLQETSLAMSFEGLGGRGQTTAILRDIAAAPKLESGNLSLAGMEGASLAAVLGLPATHPLARLGRFDLELQASGSEAQGACLFLPEEPRRR